jgi:murein DD-endopeptidase MepM/ murein hydrolase activator NlpD
MAEESQHTPEEAYTHLEEWLRTDEPPVEAEDTNPSQALRTEALLRAEEPPSSADDTNPSLITRQPLSGDWPPDKTSGGLQRVVGPVILFGAVILTALATYIWMDSEDTPDSPAVPEERVAQNVPETAPGVVSHTVTPAPTQTPPPPRDMVDQPEGLPVVFPTAAADEIAAALLTPVSVEPFTQAIQREAAPFTIHPNTTRAGVIQYTVQQGDTLQTIAAKFSLEDYYSLVWSNSRSKYSALRPGTQLNVPPEDGVYYEVTENISVAQLAENYGVDPYEIIDSEYNNLFGSIPETLLVKGMWIVIPGGEGERVNLLPANPQSGGGAPGAASGPYTLWGCSSTIGGGTLPYTRPLKAYTWMQGFSLGGHEGVDLAADVGSPVYAAGGGTVAFAGWNDTGYGNMVVIAHGPVFTLYGHLNSYSVRCGQSVTAGQQIGTSGNTGNSSGPHLHFEMRDADWNPINPASYIGF